MRDTVLNTASLNVVTHCYHYTRGGGKNPVGDLKVIGQLKNLCNLSLSAIWARLVCSTISTTASQTSPYQITGRNMESLCRGLTLAV